MIHLNGHVMCAIDTETTGLSPLLNDIVEIAVIPLNFALEYDTNYIPFDFKMSPVKYDNIDKHFVGQAKLLHYEREGFNPQICADLFLEWVDRLKLPEQKRIIPLAHNWLFDSRFIEEWLGSSTFNLIFDGRYRDTAQASLFINDCCDHHAEPCHFPKNKLSYVATQLGIEVDHEQTHTAFYDALLTAKVYKEICQRTQML